MFKKKTKTFRNFSAGSLTQLHTGSYRPGAGTVLGLGGGNYELDAKMTFSTKTQGSLACVRLERIVGHFTIEPVMLIAKDYRKGSCEYKAVLEHEKLHVATLVRFQREYARKYKKRLKNIMRDVNTFQVVSSSQADIAQAQIRDQINQQIQTYFQQITPIIQRRQQDVDTPEEYARVFAQCDGW